MANAKSKAGLLDKIKTRKELHEAIVIELSQLLHDWLHRYVNPKARGIPRKLDSDEIINIDQNDLYITFEEKDCGYECDTDYHSIPIGFYEDPDKWIADEEEARKKAQLAERRRKRRLAKKREADERAEYERLKKKFETK